MRFGRHLRQFLAALTLLVGISVPALAWASPPHAHHMVGMAHAASDSVGDSTINSVMRAPERAIAAKFAPRAAAALGQSLRQGGPASSDGCGLLNCDCSFACHVSALVPHSLPVPLAAIGSPGLSRSDPHFGGLVPEALPKPPKYLA